MIIKPYEIQELRRLLSSDNREASTENVEHVIDKLNRSGWKLVKDEPKANPVELTTAVERLTEFAAWYDDEHNFRDAPIEAHSGDFTRFLAALSANTLSGGGNKLDTGPVASLLETPEGNFPSVSWDGNVNKG